jgi:ankyrin repeat protein
MLMLSRFRWAFCQLEELRKCRTAQDIRDAIRQLPITLDRTYERILANINLRDFSKALSILYWLFSSRRPLALEELAEAAIVQPTDSSFNPDARLIDSSEVLRICGSLITCSTDYRPRDYRSKETWSTKQYGKITTVRFAHYSVKEYLLSGRAGRFSIVDDVSENHVAGSCLQYLLHIRTEVDPSPAMYPLIRYAAQFWFEHCKIAQHAQSSLNNLVYQLLSEDFQTHSPKWLRFHDPRVAPRDSSIFEDLLDLPALSIDTLFPGPLYYAVHHRFHDVTKRLLRAGSSINELHGGEMVVQHTPALVQSHVLCCANLTSFVRMYGESYITAQTSLHVAIQQNDSGMVRLLLDSGADPNVHTVVQLPSPIPYALTLAIKIWKSRTFLLKSGRFTTALDYAVSRGYADAVKILLNHGANPNGHHKGYPPLFQAAHRGDSLIIALLLRAGADVNIRYLEEGQEGYGSTALFAALSIPGTRIFRQLTDAGAVLDDPADVSLLEMFCTAVSRAGHSKNTDIVVLLLRHGVDSNHPHFRRWSPLCEAAKYGGHELTKLLLLYKFNVNPSQVDDSPLAIAVKGGHCDIAQLLFEAGADLDALSYSNNTVLLSKTTSIILAAPVGRYVNFQQLLLESRAKIYAPKIEPSKSIKIAVAPVHKRDTTNSSEDATGCIQRAARDMHWAVLRTLRKAHERDLRIDQLPSLVYCAVLVGHDGLVKLLLEAGADTHRPFDHKRPLQVAFIKGHTEIFELLQKYDPTYTVYTTSTDAYRDIMARMKQKKMELPNVT